MAEAPTTQSIDELTAELREALAPGIQLLEKLGEGGMGTVFLGRDPALKRYVVVKVLSPDLARDERARARFAREAEAAAAVAHPNVVAIYHVGQLPRSGTSYIVMQHIDGPTLESAFPAGTVAPAARARRIVGEVAQALAAAHARGLVHRDIKPSNVMLDRDSGRAVVLDFGISAAIRTETGVPAATRLTVEGSSIGTPQYMSPEQAVGEDVSDRSDVYSLGLVAFELASGQPVFDEKTPMALIAAHINREPPSLTAVRPDLDPAFAALVDRCLVKDPAQRPAANEVARILLPEGQTIVEWPPPGLERLAGLGWKLARFGTGIAAGLIALFALLYLQPASASAAWAAGEHSWLWRTLWGPALVVDEIYFRPVECSMRAGVNEACPPQQVDAGPLWVFMLSALILVLTAAFLRAVSLGWALRRELAWARRSGYPWPVIADAAWDGGPSTGQLLNGAGPYAFVTEADRLRILRDRRRGDSLLGAGALVTALVPMLWLLGLLRVGDSGPRLLTLAELLVCAIPLAAGAAVRHQLRHAERRALTRWRQATPHATRIVTPASLVQGWLATGARLFDKRDQKVRPAAVRVLASVSVAVIGVLFALPLLLFVQVFGFSHGPTMRSWQRQWFEFVGSPELNRFQWASLDSSLAVEITRLARAGPDRGRVVPAPGTPPSGLRARVRQVQGPHWEAGYERLAQDTSWPWLAPWKARADSAWAGTASVRGSRGTPDMPIFAAVLAVEAGDPATARARTRELLIRTRFALRYFGATGAGFYGLSVGNRLHGAVAEFTGDTLGVRFAADFDSRLTQFLLAHRLIIVSPFGPSLMADPEAPPALRYIGDRRLAPGMRRLLARASVTGQCFNGRELLFGASAMRRRLVDSARTLVADIPGAVAELDQLAAAADSIQRRRRGILGLPRRAVSLCVRERTQMS